MHVCDMFISPAHVVEVTVISADVCHQRRSMYKNRRPVALQLYLHSAEGATGIHDTASGAGLLLQPIGSIINIHVIVQISSFFGRFTKGYNFLIPTWLSRHNF